MSVLANARHERFAQELAKGKTYVQAHEIAGFRPNDGNASKLAARPEIQERVKEMTGRAAERAEITKADVLAMLIEDRMLARAEKQTGAAIRAAELLGKEIGMFVDRKEIRAGKLDGIEDDKLDALIGAVESLVASGTLNQAEEREGETAAGKPH